MSEKKDTYPYLTQNENFIYIPRKFCWHINLMYKCGCSCFLAGPNSVDDKTSLASTSTGLLSGSERVAVITARCVKSWSILMSPL